MEKGFASTRLANPLCCIYSTQDTLRDPVEIKSAWDPSSSYDSYLTATLSTSSLFRNKCPNKKRSRKEISIE